MSRRSSPVPRSTTGLEYVREWWGAYWLAVWFVVLATIRLTGRAAEGPGIDAQLYVEATRAFLAGADPWQVDVRGLYFAAPPPTLLPMLPFALLPADAGPAALIITGLVGSVVAIRRLGLPLWWLAFPPLVDAIWSGNPQTLLLPLLLSRTALARAIAPLVKAYAGVPLILRPDARAVLASGVILTVTIPILPWPLFLSQMHEVLATLASQAGPGMSTWALPVLLPVAVVGLMLLPRQRARWLAVPVLWPATQWYYASLALPGVTPVAAAFLAVQIPGLFALVPLVAVLEINASKLTSSARRLLTRTPVAS